MGPFARAGVSLTRSGFRLREFRSGVHGPRLALRSLTYRLPLPVRSFSSATSRRFAPAAGGIHASDPLQSRRSILQAARPISTPLRELWFPGDRSVRLVTRPSGPPSRGARFRSLPAARCFQRNHGSSFPIRYAPGGLLFLKPLGTFLTMNPSALSGQLIFCTRACFSTSSFSCITNDLHRNRRESAVNKTCPGKDVPSRGMAGRAARS